MTYKPGLLMNASWKLQRWIQPVITSGNSKDGFTIKAAFGDPNYPVCRMFDKDSGSYYKGQKTWDTITLSFDQPIRIQSFWWRNTPDLHSAPSILDFYVGNKDETGYVDFVLHQQYNPPKREGISYDIDNPVFCDAAQFKVGITHDLKPVACVQLDLTADVAVRN